MLRLKTLSIAELAGEFEQALGDVEIPGEVAFDQPDNVVKALAMGILDYCREMAISKDALIEMLKEMQEESD